MGVIGGAGGYATVTPIQGDPIGDATQNVENSAFKYNTQRANNEKTRQEAIKNEQDAIDKELENKQKRDDKFKVESTGIQPVDVKVFNTLTALKQNAADAEGEYKKSMGDPAKKAVAYTKLSNATAAMNQVASFNNDLKSAIDIVKENKGGVFDDDSKKEILENAEKFNSGQWQLNVSPDNTITIDTFDLDDNGKFTKMTGRDMSPQQLYKMFTPRTAVNYSGEGKGDSLLDDFAKKIKVTETTDGKGNVITEDSKGEAKAKAFADSLVNDENSVYKIKKLLGNPDASKEEVWNKAYSDAMSLVPTREVKKDYTGLNYQLSVKKEINDQRNSDRTYNKEKKASQTVTTSQAVNAITGKPMVDAKGNPVMVTKTSVTSPVSDETPTASNTKQKETAKERALRFARK